MPPSTAGKDACRHIFRPARSRNNAVEKLRDKRRGAKFAEKRGVRRVTDNAPVGERIWKSLALRPSAFSASPRLFCLNSTAWFRPNGTGSFRVL
jgi:hypothetical protein